MPYYVYLISDYSKKSIHSGYCGDVNKMIGKYAEHNEMSLNYPPDKYLFRLVYLEELETQGKAIDRNMYLTFMPLVEKIKEIEKFNPEWLELMPGINIEL